MGCTSSSDIHERIKEQDKKIEQLLKLNQILEHKLGEIKLPDENKPNSETNDLTNLKTTIDYRFNKLEKTVAKIHHEFKLKLFDGIVENIDGINDPKNQVNGSLTLDYGREKGEGRKKGEPDDNAAWNELFQESQLGPQRMGGTEDPIYEESRGNLEKVASTNDIRLEFKENNKTDPNKEKMKKKF